jgi:6-pyruvoyltetrahydropterin/6-carboxytetrahydropterin synthase
LTQRHLIRREIAIDAGHRIPTHGSKCRHLHGHRYTIEVQVRGPLLDGEQSGMVLDFGFLKECMIAAIDAPCDHGLMLWAEDPALEMVLPLENLPIIRATVAALGSWLGAGPFGKVYVLPCLPTAENLAAHWFMRLVEPVAIRSHGQASLVGLKVWETPNCWAAYGPAFEIADVSLERLMAPAEFDRS